MEDIHISDIRTMVQIRRPVKLVRLEKLRIVRGGISSRKKGWLKRVVVGVFKK